MRQEAAAPPTEPGFPFLVSSQGYDGTLHETIPINFAEQIYRPVYTSRVDEKGQRHDSFVQDDH